MNTRGALHGDFTQAHGQPQAQHAHLARKAGGGGRWGKRHTDHTKRQAKGPPARLPGWNLISGAMRSRSSPFSFPKVVDGKRWRNVTCFSYYVREALGRKRCSQSPDQQAQKGPGSASWAEEFGARLNGQDKRSALLFRCWEEKTYKTSKDLLRYFLQASRTTGESTSLCQWAPDSEPSL